MCRRIIQQAMFMAFAILIVGCGRVKQAKKDLLYLKNGSLDTLPNLVVPLKETKIQKNDLLSITVYSDNPEATAIYNRSMSNAGRIPSAAGSSGNVTATSSGGDANSGYPVDQKGNIWFYTLGYIHVEGKTRLELIDTMRIMLQPYLQNPYTDIRFLNSRVTVMGEVQKPGVFNIPNEKISILEVIGLAGDITIFGKKDNVLVIREQNGKREFGRLDLRRTDIFQSPYFYLQQNDIVMVEPSTKKPTATEQETMRKITLVTALATLVSTVALLVTFFK